MSDYIETETPEPAPEPMTVAEYLSFLRVRGIRLCPVCKGVGLVRVEPGRPRVKCEHCYGTGGVPMAEGEREAFEQVTDHDGDAITGSWVHHASSREGFYRRDNGNGTTSKVTYAQIDAASRVGVDAVRALAGVA